MVRESVFCTVQRLLRSFHLHRQLRLYQSLSDVQKGSQTSEFFFGAEQLAIIRLSSWPPNALKSPRLLVEHNYSACSGAFSFSTNTEYNRRRLLNRILDWIWFQNAEFEFPLRALNTNSFVSYKRTSLSHIRTVAKSTVVKADYTVASHEERWSVTIHRRNIIEPINIWVTFRQSVTPYISLWTCSLLEVRKLRKFRLTFNQLKRNTKCYGTNHRVMFQESIKNPKLFSSCFHGTTPIRNGSTDFNDQDVKQLITRTIDAVGVSFTPIGSRRSKFRKHLCWPPDANELYGGQRLLLHSRRPVWWETWNKKFSVFEI